MARIRKRDKLAAFLGIEQAVAHPHDVAAALDDVPKSNGGTHSHGEDAKETSQIESDRYEKAANDVDKDSADMRNGLPPPLPDEGLAQWLGQSDPAGVPPEGEKSVVARNETVSIATLGTADESSSANVKEGRPLLEKNHGTTKRQSASRSLRGQSTGLRRGSVISDVQFECALVRDQSTGGRFSTDRILSEAAALYGTATLKYTTALREEERDADKILGHIFADFEARQVQLFCTYHEGPENSDDKGSENTSTPLGKVLTASTELMTEAEILWDNARKKKVRFVMPPRFKSNPTVDTAWIAAVVSVCARQISHQTGGREGHRMPKLTVTELLDVIAWVEHFQDIMERIDTEQSSRLLLKARKMTQVDLHDANSQPALFVRNGAGVTPNDAEDGVAWVYKALIGLHTQARDELLIRTQAQTIEWATAAYKSEHQVHEATDGRLFTSLPEDVSTPISIQLRTICDRLPLSSDVLPAMVAVVLSTIRMVQVREGGSRLIGFERRCATANDYERMSEEWDNISSEILQECFPQCQAAYCDGPGDGEEDDVRFSLRQNLEAVSSELVHTFTSDAVRAAKSLVLPVFDPIRPAVEPQLFHSEWEDNYTQNELAKTLTATIADFLGDLRSFIGSYLLEKATGAFISASVVFYIECLLKKAGGHGDDIHKSSFGDSSRALLRMNGDISVMRSYFDGLVEEMPALARTVEEEFKLLAAFPELMSIAAGQSTSEVSDFILVLYKRTRNVRITRKVVGDLWNLIAPKEKRRMKDFVAEMEPDLIAIAPSDTPQAQEKLHIPGLQLGDMLTELYGAGKQHHHHGDRRHEAFSMGAKIERGKKKFAKATAKLTVGHSVRASSSLAES